MSTKKTKTVNKVVSLPDFDNLFSPEGVLNSQGHKFLRGRAKCVRLSFVIAYQCGYEQQYLAKILECKTERETDMVLATARIKSEGIGRTEFVS